MAIAWNGGQPTGGRAFVQGWLPTLRAAACLAWFAFPAFLAGCTNYHESGPEEWWHQAIGGKIDEQRPPPPGDKDPFPNLATVPPRPPAVDTAAWNKTTAELITDRINARQAAAVAPIPASGAAPPAPLSLGATSQIPAAGASLVGVTPNPLTPAGVGSPTGASSPPETSTRSSGGPDSGFPGGVAPVNTSAPAMTSRSGQTVNQSAATASLPGAAAAKRVADGQLPPLPAQEPPRPGVAPAPPPPAVPLTAIPPATEPSGGGVAIEFDTGSARLNDPALSEVRVLAAGRGDHGIGITGYGDALTSDPLGQSNAVALGLSRAQALATALVAQGVPYAMLRLNAEAAGRGASMRLLR